MFVQMPKKRPEYRACRDHSSFISRIADHGVDLSAFYDALKNRLFELYGVDELDEPSIESLHDQILSRMNERQLEPWRYRTRFETEYN